MSMRTVERAVGACFLLAFAFYVAGGVMVDTSAGTPAVLSRVVNHTTLIAVGALLMMLNSVAVASIAVLLFPILRRHHEVSAYGYLVCRSIEAMLAVAGSIFLLLLIPLGHEYAATGSTDLQAMARVAQEANTYFYEVAMIAVGLSGVVLCRVLLLTRLLARPLAMWGLVGYALLSLGSVGEVLGYGVGVALSIPGGLFEIVLGALLLGRGFSAVDDPERDRLPSDVAPDEAFAGEPRRSAPAANLAPR